MDIEVFLLLGTFFIPPKNKCFGGYTGISLSVRVCECVCVCPSMCPSVFKILEIACFCQSAGSSIKSHSVALVSFCINDIYKF